MNRGKIIGVSLAATLSVAGGWAWGGIEGSKHDFTGRSWSGDSPCAVCHTPHRSVAPEAAPLWNPKAVLSDRFGGADRRDGQVGLGTRLCVQCHDGTVARQAVAGVQKDRFANKENPGIFGLSHDTTDHPVGIRYPVVNKGFQSPAAVVASGTVNLPDGKVECSSCHDPHNTAEADPMLVRSNARSALCLTCHKK